MDGISFALSHIQRAPMTFSLCKTSHAFSEPVRMNTGNQPTWCSLWRHYSLSRRSHSQRGEDLRQSDTLPNGTDLFRSKSRSGLGMKTEQHFSDFQAHIRRFSRSYEERMNDAPYVDYSQQRLREPVGYAIISRGDTEINDNQYVMKCVPELFWKRVPEPTCSINISI